MKKKYLAKCDDGHDYPCFEFMSEHRANSKANIEDAKEEARRRFGASRAAQLKIIDTSRYDCY